MTRVVTNQTPNKRMNASRNRPVGSLRSVTFTPGRVIRNSLGRNLEKP